MSSIRPPGRCPSTTARSGSPRLRNGAYVEAIGVFKTAMTPFTFRADEAFITFPYVKEGVVDNTWRADDTFVLRLTSDNVVFPKPGRGTAYYDNLATPAQPLDNTFIDNNVFVKARGYAVTASAWHRCVLDQHRGYHRRAMTSRESASG